MSMTAGRAFPQLQQRLLALREEGMSACLTYFPEYVSKTNCSMAVPFFCCLLVCLPVCSSLTVSLFLPLFSPSLSSLPLFLSLLALSLSLCLPICLSNALVENFILRMAAEFTERRDQLVPFAYFISYHLSIIYFHNWQQFIFLKHSLRPPPSPSPIHTDRYF